MQQRLLQRLQRGELAGVEGGEALGFFAKDILEFCRVTLLNRADEILKAEDLGRYPAGNVRSLKVAETPPGEDEE